MTGEPPAADWSPQYCDDNVWIDAPAERVFDAVADIARWNDWWVAMRFASDRAGPLAPGDRITFDGGVIAWEVEVIAVERPRSLRLRYVSGALIGDTEWRVEPEGGGCRAHYIYHGVRADSERAAQTFGRFGTRFHSMVMAVDALDGLRRLATGEPLDAAWRQSVTDAIAAGRAKLTEA